MGYDFEPETVEVDGEEVEVWFAECEFCDGGFQEHDGETVLCPVCEGMCLVPHYTEDEGCLRT